MANTVEKLLGSAQLSALPDLTGLVPLTQPVSALTAAWSPPLKLQGEATVSSPWRGLEVGAKAGGGLTATVHPPGVALEVELGLEGRPVKLEPSAGNALADLRLSGGLEVSASGSQALTSAVSVSAEGKAAAGLALRHVLEVPGAQTLGGALGELVGRARIPFAVEPSFLAPARRELFQLRAKLGLEASAQLAGGLSGEVGFALFHGLDAQVSAEYKAALSASLGYAVYDDMIFSVGTLTASDAGWLRVVLERVHQSRLTLGATASLQVRYDLGSGLVAALEHVLALEPVAKLLDLSKELAKVAGDVAGADWPALQAKLGEKLSAELSEALKLDELVDDAAKSDLAQRLIGAAAKIVAAYERLGGELQSLLDRGLAAADLAPGGKIRRALEDLARLGQTAGSDEAARRELAFGALVGGEAERAVALLEALTGVDLESLVLGSEPFEVVEEAADQAQRALDFLDSLPKELVDRLQAFLQKQGVPGLIADLEAFADADSLKAKAKGKLKEAVEKLVGRALGEIDEEDVARLQAWAGKVKASLDELAGGLDRFKARLQKLEGEVGFTLGIELERLTRKSAVLDVELDLARASAWLSAHDQLQEGDVSGFLAELSKVADEKDEPDQVPYRLHACVLTSRRVRSTAVSLFASWVGGTETKRQRIEEERIEIRGQAGAEQRHGRYAGGFLRHERDTTGARWSAGTWLVVRGRGKGLALDGGFGEDFAAGLRFTASRRDEATTPADLAGVGRLLEDLGFTGAAAELAALVTGPKLQTRLGVSLEAGRQALKSWLESLGGLTPSKAESDAGWDADYLGAAKRWFAEPLAESKFSSDATVPRGTVLSGVVDSPVFRAEWRSPDVPDLKLKGWTVRFGDQRELAIGRMSPEAISLHGLRFARSQGVPQLVPVAKAFQGLAKPPKPGQCRDLVRGFARAAAACDPRFFDSPLFLLWLAQAGLTRMERAGGAAAQALDSFRGLATLRWRVDEAQDWQNRSFRLGPAGLAEARLGG